MTKVLASLYEFVVMQREFFSCYVLGVKTMLQLPALLQQQDELTATLATMARDGTNELQIVVSNDPVNAYNARLDAMKARCLEWKDCFPLREFDTQIVPAMITLRIVAALLALHHGPAAASSVWLILALQFVIVPFSIVPAITTLIALAQPIFIGHCVVYPALAWLSTLLRPAGWESFGTVPIDLWFIALFIIADQLVCALCLFWNPNGTPVKLPWSRIAKSIAYGLVDGKCGPMIVMSLTQGIRLDLGVMLLDYWFGITARVCALVGRSGLNWVTLFYPEHRLSHLPVVYQHAHKFHHSLNGTTAFDAHLYGTGLPEEFCCLLFEFAIASCLGIPPPMLNFNNLYLSWTDKVAHTLKTDSANGVNGHPLHHVHHTRNYGVYNMSIDMVFGTCVNNDEFPMPHGFTARCARSEDSKLTKLTFSRDR
jgi:hypothetical protein